MNKKKVLIIGGGVSSMFTAINLKRRMGSELEVVIIESNERIGKKILVTGNGRCNLGNKDVSIKNYFSEDFSFLDESYFKSELTYEFFKELNLTLNTTESGRIYPYSGKGSTVLDILNRELDYLGVKCIKESIAIEIKHKGNKFNVEMKNKSTEEAEYIVIATGGIVENEIEIKSSGFKILKSFGHSTTKIYSGLNSINLESNIPSKLQGIKFLGEISAIYNEKKIASEFGEMLFTKNGISGIPAMNISMFSNKNIDCISIDFLPEMDHEEVRKIVYKEYSKYGELLAEKFLIGIINKKIIYSILKESGIGKLSIKINKIDDHILNKIILKIKDFRFKYLQNMNYSKGQVTLGGFKIKEFNNYLESKKENNLFAVGEILDVTGACGGYNFFWCLLSSHLVARGIEEKNVKSR